MGKLFGSFRWIGWDFFTHRGCIEKVKRVSPDRFLPPVEMTFSKAAREVKFLSRISGHIAAHSERRKEEFSDKWKPDVPKRTE